MKASSKKELLVNVFGTFGYLTCLFLWIWVVIFYAPLLFENDRVMELLIPTGGEPLSAPEQIAPSPFAAAFAFALTAVVMIVTVFVLLRMPITIAKSGKKLTTKTAGSLAPLVTHGRPLPPKKKRQLTASLVKLVKLMLILVPVIAGLATAFLQSALPYEMIMLVTGALAMVSIFWFSAQYICADLLNIEPEKLV